MSKSVWLRRLAAAATVTAAACVPAQAASAATTSCPSLLLSQPFLAYSDTASYTPAPGVSPDSFSGAGWVLSGGAKIVKTTLRDGKGGYVLDLPPHARATSPDMCLPAGSPLERSFTRMTSGGLLGGLLTGGGSMYVSLAGSSVLGLPIPIVGTSGWTLTLPTGLLPSSLLEAASVDFTIVSTASVGDLQLYDLYVDPRMFP